MPSLLSIPLWCDCNEVVHLRRGQDSGLSIPLWCDCNKMCITMRKLFPALSIPLWCDCNIQQHNTPQFANVLSIPLWCDCNMKHENGKWSVYVLSIPLWCDCNLSMKCLSVFAGLPFNPTMVRLQLDLGEGTVGGGEVFQSHYGAIATKMAMFWMKMTKKLSIPLWCDCNSV